MKIDKGGIINDFIYPNRCQYVIPVYQRNYEWSGEQCRKLFEDIVNAHIRDNHHFCGSVVYAPLESKSKIDYYIIIDGQQRITTIYILLKALLDMASSDRERTALKSSLFNEDKFKTYDIDESSKLKLKPIKSDNNQLMMLMENRKDDMDKSSGIWRNYELFCELISDFLKANPDMGVDNIYDGMEHLTCAVVYLDDKSDNAQEIFERINSTGVPLSLADKIRNFVLMTDVEQDRLYEDYWLKVETMLTKNQLSSFFLDYLNMKLDGFAKEDSAYDDFKILFQQRHYTNESMLAEILHYAEFYHTFLNGSDKLGADVNKALAGLKQLNQTTVYLFLFRIFDDFSKGIIDGNELAKILNMLLSYSIRRIMCDIASNSLRGLYKTLYNRVFNQEENKQHYYDAIVSFMMQLTSRDVIPGDEEFKTALVQNNLYRKYALCRYLLISIENQGKEKVDPSGLSVEHVMPQNRNLSTAWQKMLGDNWVADRECWLHTLGNLTLTGYNSELGDRPFDEKKQKIEEVQTKVTILYKDIQCCDTWDAAAIKARAERLSEDVLSLFPIISPETEITFNDPRNREYTAAEPGNATYKIVTYYELLGEKVNVDSFAMMLKSVARKLYEIDSTVIDGMARSNATFPTWKTIPFSYDVRAVRGEQKIAGTDIYISTGFSAYDCVDFIRALLREYNLDVEEDFIYSARSYKPTDKGADDNADN